MLVALTLLMASTNIPGQDGQQQTCEAVLTTARGVHQRCAADLHSKGMTMADGPDWRRQQAADDHFAVTGHFDQESQKVDAYWGGASRGSQIRRLILSRMFN